MCIRDSLGGIPCDYDRIYQAVEGKKALFCPKGDVQEALGRVAVVADCAHGLGASRHGVPTGALADFTSFSFHAVKNFTTAEGGASAWRTLPGLDDEELYLSLIHIFCGAPQDPHEVHVNYKIGCNFFLQSDSVSHIMLKS